MKKLLIVSTLVTALSLYTGFVWAATAQTPVQENTQIPDQQKISDSQLMTPQKRTENKPKIRAEKTAEGQAQGPVIMRIRIVNGAD